MIRDLTDTTTTGISKTLVRLRNEVGALALGRVLTLVVVVEDTDAGNAIEVANQASRQHPCRIIVVIAGDRRGKNRLDAQIRLGGDAGASEIVVLRLYGALANHGPSVVVPLLLPDSPIVAWWPGEAPADVGKDPIGAMAQRRITDVAQHRNPRLMLKKRAANYAPGDTDLAWTRITRWRGLLAAALDQPPYEPITGAVVSGAPDSPSSDLLAAWLSRRLRCPCTGCRRRAVRASPRCVSSARAAPSTSCARVTSSRRCRRRASRTGVSVSRAASSRSAWRTSSSPRPRRCLRGRAPARPRRPPAGASHGRGGGQGRQGARPRRVASSRRPPRP